ncbi:MAG: metal ABC transporter ATP-binding protein [Sulfolobales archaeon]|nr:metal ABC transporter ATP-binding protein [Sulfolobales archaeon]MDW8083544.1 metal ABC transporter ATP-binding protein [Sulfolobales archaeon]
MVEQLGRSGIEVVDVYASYDNHLALESVSFSLNSPFYSLLLGPNGAGKTTLIKVLVGLLKPLKGRVSVYGFNPLTEKNSLSKLVGYLPQPGTSRPSSFIKIRDLVAMGYLSTKRPPRFVSDEVEKVVSDSLRAVGLEDLADRYLNSLSSGELHRAIIASTIARSPRLLLLDEPLASLDFNSKCELAELLLKLHRDRGVDIIMSTHEITHCAYFNPVVILINRKVLAYGSMREVLTVDNLRKAYPSITEVSGLTILAEDHAVKR